MHTYKLRLHKEALGGFTISTPSLPGCITYGENVDEAIELYLEELIGRGEIIPKALTYKK